MSDTVLFDFVESASTRIGDTATIVLQSRRPPTDGSLAITELQSTQARSLALQIATEKYGLSTPGINNSVRVYPVGRDGKPLVDENGQVVPSGTPAAWQAAIPTTARLV